jgi:hypothetical protein
LVRLCDEVGKDQPAPQEESAFISELRAHYTEGNEDYIPCSETEGRPNFPMPHFMQELENYQRFTVHSIMKALASDFGEFAFSNKQGADIKTREVLAAGWRNCRNIARIV